MVTLFISDLHLQVSRPDITQLFLRFLTQEAPRAKAIYILGDLFEAWIGDDDSSSLHQTVIDSLKALTQKGIPIYLMPGNRDFLLGSFFAQQAGCQLLSDPTVITLYGQPTLLMHGDTLCTEDKGYLRYRYCVRMSFCQKLFLGLPLKWRQAIANRLRKASGQHTKLMTDGMMDIVDTEVARVMDLYQVKQLIHGHTHRPMIRYFALPNGDRGRHIVLGDWDACGNMLIYESYESGENVRLLILNPQ